MGCRKPPPSSPARREPPYLRSIWLQAAGSGETGRLTLMATDVNIEFTGTYPAEVREEGQAGVNGRAFVELLRRLPGGDIQLRLDQGKQHASCRTGTPFLQAARGGSRLVPGAAALPGGRSRAVGRRLLSGHYRPCFLLHQR